MAEALATDLHAGFAGQPLRQFVRRPAQLLPQVGLEEQVYALFGRDRYERCTPRLPGRQRGADREDRGGPGARMRRSIGRNLLNRDGLWPLVLVILATFVALLLAEGILKVILPAPILWRAPQERYENHPTRQHVLRPSQQAFTHDKPVRINALGFRGTEVEIQKPENRFRIVVMGDSVTFGNGVGDDDTYSVQLGRMLHKAGFRNVEVINAGIPAYDTWQEALLLHEVVLSLEPDLVVLGFYENDIAQRPKVVHSIIGQEGEPPRTGLGRSLGDRWIALLKKSRLLLLAREGYQRTHVRWFPSSSAERRMALLRGDHHTALEAGWKEVDRSLRQMSALLKRAKGRFRIVIFPMPEQVWDRKANKYAYQGRLQQITREIEVPTLDLLPAFQEAAADGRTLYIPWDWHPSVEAHQITARAIEVFVRPVLAEWIVNQATAQHGLRISTASGI